MSDERHRLLSQVGLLEFKNELLQAEKQEAMDHYRATMRRAETYKDVLSRIIRYFPPSEATAEVVSPAPVASGSGHLVQAPALPGPSARRTAPGSESDDTSNTPVHHEQRGEEHRGSMGGRGPETESSAHTHDQARVQANSTAACTPITYVEAFLLRDRCIDLSTFKFFYLWSFSKRPVTRIRMLLELVLVTLVLTLGAGPRLSRLRPGLSGGGGGG